MLDKRVTRSNSDNARRPQETEADYWRSVPDQMDIERGQSKAVQLARQATGVNDSDEAVLNSSLVPSPPTLHHLWHHPRQCRQHSSVMTSWSKLMTTIYQWSSYPCEYEYVQLNWSIKSRIHGTNQKVTG